MISIKNYINGDFHNPIQNNWIDNYNPSNGLIYGKTPNSSPEDIERAYDAAKTAFPHWSQTTLDERSRILIKVRFWGKRGGKCSFQNVFQIEKLALVDERWVGF